MVMITVVVKTEVDWVGTSKRSVRMVEMGELAFMVSVVRICWLLLSFDKIAGFVDEGGGDRSGSSVWWVL